MLFLLLALPDLPEEDRLLARARQGEQGAIGQIYKAFFDPVYRFIRWRVNDPALAEDLTSDVFIKFLSALQSPHAPRQSARGWLFRVARNVLYDHVQRAIPTEVLNDDLYAPSEHDAEAQVLRNMDAERVRRTLRMLAADQQEVLILRFAQMMSLQETAETMNRSVSAIKSLQFRAIETLRQILSESGLEAEQHGIA